MNLKRGIKEEEMIQIAEWMNRIINEHKNEILQKKVSEEINEMNKKLLISYNQKATYFIEL